MLKLYTQACNVRWTWGTKMAVELLSPQLLFLLQPYCSECVPERPWGITVKCYEEYNIGLTEALEKMMALKYNQ